MIKTDSAKVSGSGQFVLHIEVTNKDKVPYFLLIIPRLRLYASPITPPPRVSTSDLNNLSASIETIPTGTVLVEVGLPNSQPIVNEISFPKSILDKITKLGQEIKNILEIKGNLDEYGLYAEFTIIPYIFEMYNKLYFYGCSSGRCIRITIYDVFPDKLYRPKEILNKILNNNVHVSYEIPTTRDRSEIVTDLYYNLSIAEEALLIYSKGFLKIYTQIYDIVADAMKYIFASIKNIKE